MLASVFGMKSMAPLRWAGEPQDIPVPHQAFLVVVFYFWMDPAVLHQAWLGVGDDQLGVVDDQLVVVMISW